MRSKRFNDHRSDEAMWRNAAHKEFDKMYTGTGPFLSRTAAYVWLAREMKMSIELCHFGLMTVKECKKAIAIIRRYERT